MAIELTSYAVPGWGVGELWVEGAVLMANDFRFGAPPADGVVDAASATEPRDTASQGLNGLVRRFARFLEGEPDDFLDVAIDLEWATTFQRAVAETLRAVPRGEVVSYGELAALAGYPGAARAAGTFCATNRFAFVVPCHRVVAAVGIGGYGSAGIEVKRRLLALEGVRL